MTGTESNDRPTAWMTCVAFGIGSEVWLYRQAKLLADLQLTVYAKKIYNPDRFPTTGFDAVSVDGRWRLPRQPWLRGRILDAMAKLNPVVAGAYASPAETKWWVGEIQRNKPDVVLAQFGNHAMDMFPLTQHFNIPLVAHFHGFDLSRLMRDRRYVDQLKRTAGQLAGYVVVAQYMRDQLISVGVPTEKIHVIPYGVPGTDIVPTRPDGGGCTFLTVGRFVGKKRPDLTLRAFAAIAGDDRSCRLMMIGDGPMLKQCQSIAEQAGIADRVCFLGAQPSDRVQAEMAAADVFVQHSVQAADGDKEGWPVAVAEAASFGLPVIATRHASIPEQIDDGVAGLLCDEGDWQTMAEHMRTLGQDSDLRRQMGRAAKRYMDSMNVETQVGRLRDVLVSASRPR